MNNSNESSSSNEDPLVAWVASELQRFPQLKTETIGLVKRGLQGSVALGVFDDLNKDQIMIVLQRLLPSVGVLLVLKVTSLVVTFLRLKEVYEETFYKTARLKREMLEENNLSDYIEAAENSGDSSRSRLSFLNGQQSYSGFLNTFVCIIASSGTGKTQLAATAALTYNEATTIYLNMADQEPGAQRFYRPHITNGSEVFKKTAAEFLSNSMGCGQGKTTTANHIAKWAKSRDDGSSPFVRMLYHLFTNEEFPGYPIDSRIKLTELQGFITRREKKFLVFLDEVPPKDDPVFPVVLCIRDTLRFIGMAPILMSTHTGAQDYVGKTSRTSLDVWTWIMSSLPRFAPFPMDAPNFFEKTERPLVLALARKAHGEGKGLAKTVGYIRSRLQNNKLAAWTSSPALQLVQLFSTDVDINGNSFSNSHSLVGHHFGCLLQGYEEGKQKYSCGEASIFRENLAVAPVCASYEPLLYLALVTWDEDMLREESQVRFPLTDEFSKALTVREAYTRCSNVFTAQASTENLLAEKLDGNLFEVLVHASLTLASMKTSSNDVNYLPGVNLNLFIPLVRELMLGQYLYELPATPNLFKSLNFEWSVVPALGGSNSGFPEGLVEAAGSNLGFLERPSDGEMVDGQIWMSLLPSCNPQQKEPFISIECKNYTDGVNSGVLRDVFQRIKASITCCLVFVSFVQSGAFKNTNLEENVKRGCFAQHDPDSVSVVLWKEPKQANPEFLTVGGEAFCAKGKTSLLVVIIEVGSIDASINRKRKRSIPPCANPIEEI